MLARHQERLEKMHRELTDEKTASNAYGADAGDAEPLAAALSDVEETLGSPDVMIYNAVQFHPGAVSTLGNQPVRT